MLQVITSILRFPTAFLAVLFCLSVTVGSAEDLCCIAHTEATEQCCEAEAAEVDCTHTTDDYTADDECCTEQHQNSEKTKNHKQHCTTCALCCLCSASLMTASLHKTTTVEMSVTWPSVLRTVGLSSLHITPPTPPPDRFIA